MSTPVAILSQTCAFGAGSLFVSVWGTPARRFAVDAKGTVSHESGKWTKSAKWLKDALEAYVRAVRSVEGRFSFVDEAEEIARKVFAAADLSEITLNAYSRRTATVYEVTFYADGRPSRVGRLA